MQRSLAPQPERHCTRPPTGALRPFVTLLWASRASHGPSTPRRERILPSGAAHIAIRLDAPLTLLDAPDDPSGVVVDRAVIAGPRTTAHLKELTPSASVGAQLHPGAAQLLFTDPPAIAGCHVPLECAWGAAAPQLVDQLQSEANLERRIDLLEAALLARLPRLRALHPAIAHALQLFASGQSVTDAVEASGYSHRHFLTLFRGHIGLAPKDHCRIMRFRRAVTRLAAGEPIVDTAIRVGYADQPHLTREFRTIAGMTPAQYTAAQPRHESHVPIS